ncbi:PREDICTED: transcription factor VOZ1-like isoform X2 [Tarenaya hassleriana]|uniref:transcription factor VOZ1-like isoform X2 n=1 Tax=Tarenaya hassleriana TaxID=28532 RepID=UPI00053C3DA9|nr:PREDICTED: transcription factor VOZ1-like isoform X2 [Tarenaya hassleriana]
MTGKRIKTSCVSASHKLFKDKAKNRVDDLQGMLTDLQFARKESRTTDVTLLEEQVHQMLREWKAELNEPFPASSFHQGGAFGSFSSDICQLLQLCDEEDDATSKLAAPKPEPSDRVLEVGNNYIFQGGYDLVQEKPENGFPLPDHCKDFDGSAHLEYHHQYDLQLELEPDFNNGGFMDGTGYGGEESLHISTLMPPTISICPPPSAFLGPKCSLWDCPRPATLGFDWFHDYCSSFHAALAFNEGPPGMNPIVRPGGIGLKDGLLFAALSAKADGKDVGIPECEGAATAKSPWNAPEIFDLSVLEGEIIREWLFFDKPRRAFESGNRKQRSLPDYCGRGWHESRKQIMNEFGGLKRSYYMDPQPLRHFEWHLYEYEINKCEACALYRLELKLAAVGKKNSKGKNSNDSVADLQTQMGRLTADNNKRCIIKVRPKVTGKMPGPKPYPVQNMTDPTNDDDKLQYGVAEEYSYLVGS